MSVCRFCGQPAAVRVALSQGCLCYPDDREQYLCGQHLLRATPLGTMTLIERFDA